MTMERFLRGSPGFRYTEQDRLGREIVAYRRQERAARDGAEVRLTVDLALQHIVETELEAVVKQYRPASAVALLMRPSTGEVLAVANRPLFDPNLPEKGLADGMKNRAIIDMVEPGSTFKIVTAAAALEEKTASLGTVVYCHNGSFPYGGALLRDHHAYGNLTVEDILAKSSNIGSAKLAFGLGDRRLYEYVRRFGFGERTGIDLPGEIGGMVHPPHRWSKISITRIPMGHEVAVTPLQIAAAMGVVANGGRLMMPQIVRQVVDCEGREVRSFEPVEVRRVISEKTAAEIRKALTKVVSKEGTARLAKVPGFKVAGKTGTAQKVAPEGGYAKGKYVVSFVGFMPADNPEFVGVVMVDDAKAPEQANVGGLIAAPVFRAIAEKAARYLNLEPSVEADETPGIITERGGRR
jgi:cell division protein FtsI (penicillin-binding protein 3)/stage V sporulation protein D (sporulation-specific penicillin-binding protein)